MADENAAAKSQYLGLKTAYKTLQTKFEDAQEARRKLDEECKKLTKELAIATASVRSLECMKSRHEAARRELAKHGQQSSGSKEETKKLQIKVKKLEAEIKDLRESMEAATEQLHATEQSHKKEVERLEAAAAAHDLLQVRYTAMVESNRDHGGRPRGNAGRKILEE
eukprot:5081610-Pleurochrysis_carterae.AAC.1